MIRFPETRFGFVHIAKTGGSSITAALAVLTEHGQAGQDDNERGWQVPFHTGAQHDPPTFLRPRDYTLATVVRNPLSRTVSLWSYFGRAGETFLEFVHRLTSTGKGVPPSFRWPQHAIAKRCDIVGHFEDLEGFLATCWEALGQTTPPPPLPHRLNRRNPEYDGTPTPPWESFYEGAEGQQAADLLRAATPEDFEGLGYA